MEIKFQNQQNQYYNLVFSQSKLRLTASPITESIGVVIGVLLLWIGGLDVLVAGTMSSEDFIRFIMVLFSVLGPIRLLGNVSVDLQKGAASAERVFSILDTSPDIADKPDAINIDSFSNQIEFNNVEFKYENGDAVLTDVSFSIPKGKVVALVGPSGAGKSTVADLIPRFYDVRSGAILIDGINVRNAKVAHLRNQMGIVTQETILFDETIEFNITYGVEDYSQEELYKAAKAANAYDFILDQPNGFQTIIGEKGVKLSGGQRQRLAIARAILRNPPILILDEATSSLDTESERKVQDALENLMKNRTVIVIAHRLSTIRNADQIIVLDKGQIIEKGSHQALYISKGFYYKLHNMQFENLELQ